MKALSLWQPWAQAVVLGLKTFETRSWSTRHRGRIAIHAAKRAPAPRRGEFSELYQALRLCGVTREELPLGAIVGLVDVLGVSETQHLGELSDQQRRWGDFGPGRFAWRLSDPWRCAPIPLRGRQGLFDLPSETAKALGRAHWGR